MVAHNLAHRFHHHQEHGAAVAPGGGLGSITLVGSINAYGGYGAPGYSAAKAGLSGLVAALATPLGAESIRINCLALGTVDTENLRHLAHTRGVKHDLRAVAERAPLRRILQPPMMSLGPLLPWPWTCRG